MSGRSRRVGAYRRALLSHGWQVCAQPPSAEPGGPPPDTADWIDAAEAGTAACVLRAAGRWSLDGEPLRFDAFHWWYRLRFDRPAGFEPGDLTLGFDGLATLARVWLNGEPLLDSDNMFLAHACAVGERLKPQGNELLLRFASLDEALAARKPRPRWRAPMVENQQLRWWRTTLLGRTPGWSPPCAAVGPWRDIWLEDRAGVRCEVLALQCGAHHGQGTLTLACELDAPGGVAGASLTLSRNGQRLTGDLARDTAGAWRLHLELSQVDLWWPHTHGEPALYDARLQVTPQRAPAFEVDLGRVGFRSLAIERSNGDFSVVVNGVPVFCRGACWMPIDPVALKAPAHAYRQAVSQCRAAGMNMLRVAGPTVYEDDAFLDACDEFGVLVWQDFMFANMDYPADDPAFMAGVQAEVKQQAARWQGRPSLALLCGNSEVSQQAAMWGAPRELWMQPWFEEGLPALVHQVLPDAAYWPSSAWDGAFPHQVDAGTVSYYGVGAYLRPQEDARRSGLRFASECLGFSNVPEPEALARLPGGLATRVTHAAWKARAPRDLGAGWDFEDVRDHYLAHLFDLDPAKLRYSDHERYLALSRVASGEMMARAFAEWRAAGSACRGALVWFLRDLWAGAGWGLLDDAGQPKACWHALARVLQPRTVLLTDEGGNGLVAHLVNEWADRLRATLRIAAWRGSTATLQAERAVEVAPRSTQALPLMAMLEHFADLNHAYRFGPLNHDVVVASLHDQGGRLLGRAFHFPGGMGLPREAEPGLAATASVTEGGAIQLRLSTQRFALGVHIDATGLRPDDQYFHLVPGEDHVVSLHPVDERKRPWRCSVQALNAASAITVRAPDGR